MTGKESGAWELNRGGRIHRAADFDQLLSWVREYRVSGSDSFRKAGSSQWIPVMSREEFASLLNPDNQWTVSMRSGVFKAPDFDVLVAWAKGGRITEDAVVEGPRTPPGGVKASALPALAPFLKELPSHAGQPVQLRIDGNDYRAGTAETVRKWIRESRVPVDAEISMDGKTWEPVSMCGLFDLEDWPRAAHGRVEEESLPEMPAEAPPEHTPEPAAGPVEDLEEVSPDAEEETPVVTDSTGGEAAAFTVVTAESEIMVESTAELRKLLKRRQIYSYDHIKHPSISSESMSVGEFLEGQRNGRKYLWLLLIPAAAAVIAVLDLTDLVETVPWF